MSRAAESLEKLLELMRQLRGPEGCPWDREQDFASIAPYTIEEAYEVADAIARADMQLLRDELGDLLFQVVFHAQLAGERGAFDFADVAQGIHAKLVRRHPHVFRRPQSVGSGQAFESWESQKALERAERGATATLSDVPVALPALVRAAKLGRRAGRVGFDWEDAAGVRAKVAEELGELDAAAAIGNRAAEAEELGDLLFALANWARHRELDPEAALRAACSKFERRFEHMERAASAAGTPLPSLTAADWARLWDQAKDEFSRRSSPDG